MNTDAVVRVTSAGLATGGRAFTGLAALALATPTHPVCRSDLTLGKPWVRATASVLAGVELVGDKLPQAPSRLGPPGLTGRVVAAAGVGAIVADRSIADRTRNNATGEPAPKDVAAQDAARRDLAGYAAIAVAAALTSSWLGTRARSLAASRFGTDRIGAFAEDAVVFALAYCAARPASSTDAKHRGTS